MLTVTLDFIVWCRDRCLANCATCRQIRSTRYFMGKSWLDAHPHIRGKDPVL